MLFNEVNLPILSLLIGNFFIVSIDKFATTDCAFCNRQQFAHAKNVALSRPLAPLATMGYSIYVSFESYGRQMHASNQRVCCIHEDSRLDLTKQMAKSDLKKPHP